MGEIRFVGTGETRGYPYLVCKKFLYKPNSRDPCPIYETSAVSVCYFHFLFLVTGGQ